VTIFGESAGGMSVSYQLMSRKTKDLFQAAIIQSGPLHVGGLMADDIKPYPELHTEVARKAGCQEPSSMVKCLQEKPPQELFEHLQMFDQCNSLGRTLFMHAICCEFHCLMKL
jgi:carboxylesterase 2